MADEVERLVVGIEGDYSKLLNDTKKGVKEAEKELDKLADGPKKAQGEVGKLSNMISGQLMAAATGFIALFSANQIVNFFTNITKASVAANAQFETFQVQFTTLLGDAGKAKQRIDELAEFGQKTPFELPEIVEASRTLQTFGGTVLAQGENLRRVGDAAAAVNASFQEVAFWTGRMYSAIQSGRPFGEAAMRLQELGILTGETRTKLEDMQKAGASGIEIWDAYTETIDTRFAGAMDNLSKTFQGLMSNLADFQGMLLREGGEELFAGVKDDAQEFYDIISDPEAKEAIIAVAKAAGELADTLREAITGPLLADLQEMDPAQLERIAESIENLSDATGRLTEMDTVKLGDFVDSINGLVDAGAGLLDVVNILKDISTTVSGLDGLAAAGLDVKEVFLDIANPFYALGSAMDDLNGKVEQWTGRTISELISGEEAAADEAERLAAAYADYGDVLQQAADATADIGEQVIETAEDFSRAAEMVADAATEIMDLQEDIAGKREELEADHGEKIAEITENYEDKKADIIADREEALIDLERDIADARADAAEEAADALADLEQETAQRREEINRNTAEQLADLERDTQQSIEDVRDDAHLQEQREEEDHQREMQRLRESYLDDLTDAVKNRDARAIVDLRRRFQRETRERETDHRTQQQRGREDSQARIDEIRETERQRREEILRSQQQQLADLQQHEQERRAEIQQRLQEQLADISENEARKREEIEASFQEQMAKNDENFAQQMEKENQQYEERKAKLDEALAKRLEDIAKELADEKDINEEGARAILEALNKTFGIGGDIDQLMEDFQNRRRTRMTVQVEFEQSLEGTGDTNTPTHPAAGSGGAQGSHPGAIPGFAAGGSFWASSPTLFVAGEGGQPEHIAVTPMDQMRQQEMLSQKMAMAAGSNKGRDMSVQIEMRGSAPPGVKAGDRDAIASTLVAALREAGIDARAK